MDYVIKAAIALAAGTALSIDFTIHDSGSNTKTDNTGISLTDTGITGLFNALIVTAQSSWAATYPGQPIDLAADNVYVVFGEQIYGPLKAKSEYEF